MLHSHLSLNQYSQGKDWGYLFQGLMLCGAVQGLILGTLQGVVLWAMGFTGFQKILRWIGVTIVAMAVGMVLPMAMAVLSGDSTHSFDNRVMGGWVMSWLLTGLLLGAMVVHHKYQKIRFAFINAGAYLFWGMATAYGALLLGAVLDHVSMMSLALIGNGLFIALMLTAGLGLNSFVLLKSMMSRRSLWLAGGS